MAYNNCGAFNLLLTWMTLADLFADDVFGPNICLLFCYKETIIL